MHFIGIDLAWSSKNLTGFTALQWDGSTATLVELPSVLRTDTEIIERIQAIAANDSVVVAIDAPLLVPNETGQRPAEAEIGKAFGRYDASAHSANRQLLSRYNGGIIRGEALVSQLAALAITHDAAIHQRQPTRQVFEVYPHPAMVVIFGLNRILKYKSKHRRAFAQWKEAFTTYQRHLANLRDAEPALSLPESLLDDTNLAPTGTALKSYEDKLDAVFCAYIALYYWWWGTERCKIYGDVKRGYIIAPIAPTL